MQRPIVWLIGDCGHCEFWPAVEFLGNETLLHKFTSIQETGEYAGPEPEFILFAAACPGRFSSAQIEGLHRRAPLAKLLALLGGWCEGEVRSGRPWPGVTRIYAHQWQARLLQEVLPARKQGGAAPWQPRTASEIDRLLIKAKTALGHARRLIGIMAARRTAFEALAGACESQGQSTVWLLPPLPPPVQHVDAILCDATLDLTTELALLSSLREQLHAPPAILLLDFPRQDDIAQAANAGVTAVLARPYLIADLAAEIERVTSPPASFRHIAAA